MVATIDWIVLASTLLLIIGIGIWKSRGQRDLKGYFLGGNTMSWYKVMFSVMATQASAITFLSAPGQAFTDGMRFVQYYFGLPLAIILVTSVLVPAYHKLKVITAYEFLEKRFDVRVRVFTALLFLMQRGLAAGLTIYAPALVMSALLGWNIYITCAIMGILVVIYTLSGGAKAVAYTQLQQMLVILTGMFIAGWMVFKLLKPELSFADTLQIAGKANKLNVIVTDFNFSDKYNIWSGLLGGFFLALSYFGTDQSQVGRYLSAKSIKHSSSGLLMNAIVKIPMQFGILFIGVALYVFYIFNPQPVIFNKSLEERIKQTDYAAQYEQTEGAFRDLNTQQAHIATQLLQAQTQGPGGASVTLFSDQLKEVDSAMNVLRKEAKNIIEEGIPGADTNDTNYIFLYFVLHHLPIGFIGLLLAVIFSASWSSTSSELNALSGTLVVDFYKRLFKPSETDKHYVYVSRIATAFWGLLAIVFAFLATQLDSLIEAVNLLGSLFYGTILGVFVAAFLGKNWQASAVFWAALITEISVILIYMFADVGFLWLNPLGCFMVVGLAFVFHFLLPNKPQGNVPEQKADTSTKY